MKNSLLVFLLSCALAASGADDADDNDYYVAIAISEFGLFETGKGYTYAHGWHTDSMHDANQHALTQCEKDTEAGIRCVSSSSMLGGCIALAEGNIELEPDEKGNPTNWSRLFVASSQFGRQKADEAVTESCASIKAGYDKNDIMSWNCRTVYTFCASDVEETNPPATEVALTPLCDDEGTPENAECWTKLLDTEDCYVRSTLNNRDLFAAVESGSVHSCPDKVLNGNHRVTFTYVDAEDEMRIVTYEGSW